MGVLTVSWGAETVSWEGLCAYGGELCGCEGVAAVSDIEVAGGGEGCAYGDGEAESIDFFVECGWV